MRNGALVVGLRIENRGLGVAVQSVSLAYQVRIEPARRRYNAEQKAALVDLFGTPERWGSTLRPLPWATARTVVPGFVSVTTAEVDATPAFALNVAAENYVRGLSEGIIPLTFLFSGTVFYMANDVLQAAPIPWDREAHCELPVEFARAALPSGPSVTSEILAELRSKLKSAAARKAL
ncbi:MAG: hypothetical protein JO041_10295 [Acidobacteria bacterium]|nr:hypothetical protein [Acidobacteriota bacterium]